MDLLYARYSSPMDLINRYINQGRFGAFVQGFMEAEMERRKQEAERDEEWKLWMAYIRILPDKSFDEWKKQITQPSSTKKGGKSDADLTDDDIKGIIDSLFADPKPKE